MPRAGYNDTGHREGCPRAEPGLPLSRAIQIAETNAETAALSGPFDAGEAKGYLDALRDVAAGRIGR